MPSPQLTPSGYLLPSIHSAPYFFTPQPNPTYQAEATHFWSQILLTYARHRRLFVLRVEDAEDEASRWAEVLRNERIRRRVLPDYLSTLIAQLVASNRAIYDPPKQTRSVLLYWRSPEEWATVLHDWASSTGQLNTILTFFEISSPPLDSPLAGIPTVLLRKASTILEKAGKAQIIAVADGEGVRFFATTGK